MSQSDLERRFRRYWCACPSIDLSLDISQMMFEDSFFEDTAPSMQQAYDTMDALEAGAIANPDENRMVGHYWLRAPRLAPKPELRGEIEKAIAAVKEFASAVHSGNVRPPGVPRFTQLLSIGIGGSALGPMFVSDALGDPTTDRMTVHFIDNTDPDGVDRILRRLGDKLSETLCVVTSKSGTTPETRNGMILVAKAFEKYGLSFPKQAAAITGVGSSLDRQATEQGWLARLPMWDWVGGRTSELSAVGLLPAALQGIDMSAMLEGAAACDAVTRNHETLKNPAALLALMWYHATRGKGEKQMVVLPYKDRLLLLSRFLQQLVMESLGKELDLSGRRVEQGLTVYGNKGSTDQHAFVQQLRDGRNDFFVTFIRVLESGGSAVEIEPGITAGDYLHGFLLGTREALFEKQRQSMTLTIRRVDARSVGVLIALFERAVGLYASLIGVNAYHQPGVEAGKKAAAGFLALQSRIAAALSKTPITCNEISQTVGTAAEQTGTVFSILEHLAANGRAVRTGGDSPDTARFALPA